MQKFVELMTSCNRTVIKNISSYICQAFYLRNSLIVTWYYTYDNLTLL